MVPTLISTTTTTSTTTTSTTIPTHMHTISMIPTTLTDETNHSITCALGVSCPSCALECCIFKNQLVHQ